jgi:hypothetical protein
MKGAFGNEGALRSLWQYNYGLGGDLPLIAFIRAFFSSINAV